MSYRVVDYRVEPTLFACQRAGSGVAATEETFNVGISYIYLREQLPEWMHGSVILHFEELHSVVDSENRLRL